MDDDGDADEGGEADEGDDVDEGEGLATDNNNDVEPVGSNSIADDLAGQTI